MKLFRSYKKLKKPFGKILLFTGFILPLILAYAFNISDLHDPYSNKDDAWSRLVFEYVGMVIAYFVIARILIRSFIKKRGL